MTMQEDSYFTDFQWEILEKKFMSIGARSLSMDDIAGFLGMSKKTLYERVESKSALIEAIIRHTFAKESTLGCLIGDEAHNAVHEMYLVFLHVSKMISKLSKACINDLKKYYPEHWNFLEEERRKFIYKKIKTNIQRGQSEGLYRDSLNADMVAALYRYIATTIVDDAGRITDYHKEELYKEFITYHLHGICTSQGQMKMKEYGFL